MLEVLPPPLPGTRVRILATSDLGAATVPLRTTSRLRPGGGRPAPAGAGRRGRRLLGDRRSVQPCGRRHLAELVPMPAGLRGDATTASTVAPFSGAARQLPEWLGREPDL